ncbi:MAG: HpcH/HpaI aldolase/citrate lyase family protein [Arenibacterium sp.]
MPAPTNTLKKRLLAGETLIGCWVALADDYAAEIMGGAGFDWLLIDGEHAPNDLRSIRAQLSVLERFDADPVVRLPVGETWMIKQLLDAGAQTLLIPMVESAEQARELVRACRYPPAGIRGMGAALGRASGFNTIPDYVTSADDQICLLVQVESRAGIEALDEILAVEGVDGVFIGPADLSADMGFQGNAETPEMRQLIGETLGRIAKAGKSPGILGMSDGGIERYLSEGARFVAVAADVMLLAQAARASAAKWKG